VSVVCVTNAAAVIGDPACIPWMLGIRLTPRRRFGPRFMRSPLKKDAPNPGAGSKFHSHKRNTRGKSASSWLTN
jgi:hypothetical protein